MAPEAYRDEVADAILIKFSRKRVAHTEKHRNNCLIDYAKDNSIVAVDFLSVSEGINLINLPKQMEIKDALAQWNDIKVIDQGYSPLVSTQWVEEHGGDNNVRLVEIDSDTSTYREGHIAGAVCWDWRNQLQQRVQRDITSKAEMEQLLGGAGIDNTTTIVLYGDNNNWLAAWAFWQIRYYGHQDIKLMDGGRNVWAAENRPLTTDIVDHPAKIYKASEPDESIRAYRDQVLASVGEGSIALVDVRAPAEYSGELLAPEDLPLEGCQRGGHIPGAANIPWGQAVNQDGTFKSADDLQALYGGKGIDGSKETITYCRIGERSSHTWFVLTQLLGHNKVRIYDGSWTEWGSMIGVPIER